MAKQSPPANSTNPLNKPGSAQTMNPRAQGGQDFLSGGGEMGALMRSMDWSATPLGPLNAWPESLRTVAALILASSFPMAILWGNDLISIYNDAYRVIAGDRHPRAMGRSAREVWPEAWEFNKSVFEAVMARGETLHFEDRLFRIVRNGRTEDACFTLSYSPILLEAGRIGGTLVVLVETTQRKRAEKELLAAHGDLEKKVEERTVELQTEVIERTRAEKAVQTTSQRFYTVLSSMYAALLLVTDEGRVEFANQTFCDYFDLNDSPADLVGLSSSEILAKIGKAYLYPDEAMARIKEIVNIGKPVKGEEVAMRGGISFLRDFVPIHINGKSFGRLWHHADITERKGMEEELRKSRDELEQRVAERTTQLARFAEAMNSAGEGVIMTDTEWRIEYVNHAFTRICGYESTEVIGREIGFLRAEKTSHAAYDRARASALAGQPVIVRYFIRRKTERNSSWRARGRPSRTPTGIS